MNCARNLIVLVVVSLTACGSGSHSGTALLPEKIEGPDIKSLSHEQLMAVLHECHQYGASDDPKVKYTTGYCSAAQSAHAMEGYTTPSTAAVDPSLNKMH